MTLIKPRAIYKGFSTQKWLEQKTLRTSNFETVKNDILNHIFTSKGERVMMPEFGTRIPKLAFEPNDEYTRKIIYDDIKEVIDYDPRVNLIALEVVSLKDNNAIIGFADVFYIEFEVRDILRVEVKLK
jgi:phage baseplate assembly protein W